ncbi:MAG: universal stress protein [Saprospiraceae bacterium]|nr:universal stress protein [Saprospiraceae bacterium]
MKNILILIDYSEYSAKLWHYTLHLAKHFNATVHATYIFHPEYLDLIHELAILEEAEGDDQYENFIWLYKKMEEERLEKFIGQLTPSELKSIPVEKEIIYGYPIIELLRMQEEKPADLIVMGLHDSDLEDQRSEISEALINYGEIPLLLVPPTVKYHPIRHMMLPTENIQTEILSLDYLKDWSEHLKAKLFCYHLQTGISSTITNDIFSFNTLTHPRKNEQLEITDDFSPKDDWIEHVENMTSILDTDILALATHDSSDSDHAFEEECIRSFTHDLDIPLLIMKNSWLSSHIVSGHQQSIAGRISPSI